MLQAADISAAFSQEALEILADTLMLAAKNGYAHAQPAHLIEVLNRQAQIRSLLTSLKAELAGKSDAAGPDATVGVNRVSLGADLKKILYLAYGESLITNHPQVTLLHFLIPLNDYLKPPLDAQDVRVFIRHAGSAAKKTGSKKTSTLEQYAENLTLKAQTGKLDPVIGRQKEIDQLIRILARRTKSNAVLLGDPGVGKTAIVEGLALKISQNDVPKLLADVQIYSLNLTSMLAGTSYQGELEERLQNLGDINVIGATTADEYRQYIEKDAALERRFEPVKVDEPSSQDTLKILASVAEKLQKHHGVALDQPVLQAAIDLSSRYIADRFLPDKAIDLLDEATSGAKVAGKTSVSVEDIKAVLSQRTGIPVTSLTEKESLELLGLEDKLKQQIIGQAQAVKAVADVIKRSRAGLKDPNRPIGSFLLLGPTGVGKTELAKALARTVYNSEKAMVRLDMSEFTEAHTADKLIGAPPGYVGYEEGGQLTNPIRRHPYSLILLDELEKAHPKVFDIFLQVLEDGRLTDSQGHTADFKNTIIIMTSNIDVSEFLPSVLPRSDLNRNSRLQAEKGSPAGERSDLNEKVNRTDLMKALSHHLRPEFLNRIDDIILMNQLNLAAIKQIARLQLTQVQNRLKEKGVNLEVPDATLEKLANLGNVAEFGARPLKRLIQNHIEEPIAELIIAGKLKSGDKIEWGAEKIK
ncbi:MAG: ATPase with chaperone activity, ATP-binding subunit [Candidatus Beckwithbacteria bacterium GW2011_GWA2_47_25]|nr:MAG: ATPase with chaperone activity, ATP-binding subunit [Candidatus Beckwithbacteria bacterium GW2011_GWA2_47_25]